MKRWGSQRRASAVALSGLAIASSRGEMMWKIRTCAPSRSAAFVGAGFLPRNLCFLASPRCSHHAWPVNTLGGGRLVGARPDSFGALSSPRGDPFLLHRARGPAVAGTGVRRRIASMTMTENEDSGANAVAIAVTSGLKLVATVVAAAAVLVCAAYGINHGGDMSGIGARAASLLNVDVGQFLQESVDSIRSMGPLGYLYFGALYVVAEILAIPAIPLAASSGYLFGLAGGTSIVIASATVAAGISFQLGRTFLRSWVLEVLGDNPKFRAIDAAIGKEGFRIILLLRLSPIFPFALSNYLYGLTAVDFWPYLFGTMLGFLPGTLCYVYTGEVGQALLGGGDGGFPWWAYAGAAGFLAFLGKTVSDVASTAIAEMDPSLKPDSDSEQDWS
ncbi:unnamed protein product [Phaeothamnion confervicola]